MLLSVSGDVAQMVERSLSMREVQDRYPASPGVCSIVVSTSPCGGDIPGSNPGTRNLTSDMITPIDLKFLFASLHIEVFKYTLFIVIQGDKKR